MFTKGIQNLKNKATLINKYRNKEPKTSNYPLVLNIESSSRCNLRCPMCGRMLGFKRPTGDMEFGVYKKIIDETYPHVEFVVLHASGEPLMNENLSAMVNYAKQRNVMTMFSTSATLLNEKKTSDLLKAGLDIIIFAVDGVTKETYEKIRVGAKYERVISNIMKFINLKKKLKKHRPFIVIQFIKMEENKHEVFEFRKYWSKSPVEVFIKPSTDWGGKQIVDRSCHCDRLWYQPLILHNGDIVPCCMDFNGDYCAGNIKDNHFFKIWNGEEMNQIRKLNIENRLKLCRNCNYLPPRNYNLLTDTALCLFNVGVLTKLLYKLGYTKKSQL